MTISAQLDGKVAYVTGAASGLGRAAAIAIAEAGARLMLVDIDGKGLAETAEMIGQPDACLVQRADVRLEADVNASIARLVECFGGIDLALNNAGILGAIAPLANYPAADFAEVLTSNVYSVFLCMQAQIRHMAGKGGVILNMSSESGLRTSPNVCAYVTSKHALIGLTKAAAAEYGASAIRVNAICPGFVRTPMTGLLGPAGEKAFADSNPIRRVADPEEIARTIVFLLSDHASYMTGSSVVIDGGFTIS